MNARRKIWVPLDELPQESELIPAFEQTFNQYASHLTDAMPVGKIDLAELSNYAPELHPALKTASELYTLSIALGATKRAFLAIRFEKDLLRKTTADITAFISEYPRFERGPNRTKVQRDIREQTYTYMGELST
jgi:hypothetical protein